MSAGGAVGNIVKATLEVDDDVFWNWLADEVQHDLDGLRLTGVRENRTRGTLLFDVERVGVNHPKHYGGDDARD